MIKYGSKRLTVAVVQSLSHVQLFVTPWTAACQASLSYTISQSLLKLISFELVMPSNHLILCCPLLLMPSVFPCIRVCINRTALLQPYQPDGETRARPARGLAMDHAP